MCGISGQIGFENSAISMENLEAMITCVRDSYPKGTNTLRHRASQDSLELLGRSDRDRRLHHGHE